MKPSLVCEFFAFLPISKDFHKYAPSGGILSKKIDPGFDVVATNVEVARLSAMVIGVEVQGPFLRVVDVATCVARTWHELGAVGAKIYGAKL